MDGACGGAPAELSELARAIPLPLEKKMISPKNLAAAAQLRRLLASGEYDLVSCHTALAAFFTRLAVEGLPKSRRPRVVCIAHGYLFDRNTSAAKTALLAGAEKFTAPVTDLVLTMNRWDFAYASTHRLGRRVANIPGMGVDFSSLDRADPRAGLACGRSWALARSAFCWSMGRSSPGGRARRCCCVPWPCCRSGRSCCSPVKGSCCPAVRPWPVNWGWRTGWSSPAM